MGKATQLLSHPSELRAVIQLFWFRKPFHPQDVNKLGPSLKRCYELLNKTSRSFAAVIQELNPELKDAIMIFYLVLRALDTVEDDMSIDPEIKVPLLRSFHEKLSLKDWTFDGNALGEKDRVVLVEFDVILAEYHKLKDHYQDIIKKITNEMGNGMADYILDENFNTQGVATNKDYDLYCHYVAGLVGEGLTKLMVSANFANEEVIKDNFAKSESMGLFLQKTNIIRDYHEDLEDGRSFWPKETWSKYTSDLTSFHKDQSIESETQGLYCINDLVLNALNHVTDVLTYLSLVKDPSCFNFCAIPQVMAIATLATIYNNPKVLHSNVKIRKGTTCNLILNSRTLPDVVNVFRYYVKIINHKSSVRDPNYLKIGIKLGEIEQFCEKMYPTSETIPKTATLTQSPITKFILERNNIDDQIKQIVSLETLKCNVTLGLGLFSVLALVYSLIF